MTEIDLIKVSKALALLNFIENMPYGSQLRRDCAGSWECDLQDERGSWETISSYNNSYETALRDLITYHDSEMLND